MRIPAGETPRDRVLQDIYQNVMDELYVRTAPEPSTGAAVCTTYGQVTVHTRHGKLYVQSSRAISPAVFLTVDIAHDFFLRSHSTRLADPVHAVTVLTAWGRAWDASQGAALTDVAAALGPHSSDDMFTCVGMRVSGSGDLYKATPQHGDGRFEFSGVMEPHPACWPWDAVVSAAQGDLGALWPYLADTL